MATISQNYDVRIKVIFPLLTKSISNKDVSRINATGSFSYQPQKQVDVIPQAVLDVNIIPEQNKDAETEKIKEDFGIILRDLKAIEEAFRKRSKHIILKYDAETTENEALANAEAALFGNASGEITYDMYAKTLAYEQKINKYISHQSIENKGVFGGAA